MSGDLFIFKEWAEALLVGCTLAGRRGNRMLPVEAVRKLAAVYQRSRNKGNGEDLMPWDALRGLVAKASPLLEFAHLGEELRLHVEYPMTHAACKQQLRLRWGLDNGVLPGGATSNAETPNAGPPGGEVSSGLGRVEAALEALKSASFYVDQITYQMWRKPRQGLTASTPEHLEDTVRKGVAQFLGVDENRLYGHQVEALMAIDEGHDVMLCTRTSSGKSL